MLPFFFPYPKRCCLHFANIIFSYKYVFLSILNSVIKITEVEKQCCYLDNTCWNNFKVSKIWWNTFKYRWSSLVGFSYKTRFILQIFREILIWPKWFKLMNFIFDLSNNCEYEIYCCAKLSIRIHYCMCCISKLNSAIYSLGN